MVDRCLTVVCSELIHIRHISDDEQYQQKHEKYKQTKSRDIFSTNPVRTNAVGACVSHLSGPGLSFHGKKSKLKIFLIVFMPDLYIEKCQIASKERMLSW